MNITLNTNKEIKYGIVGHVGVGHIHSHSGFTQDDSAGFAVVSSLIKKAVFIDTRIKEVYADIKTGKITVTTHAGGQGSVYARRGITPYEALMLNNTCNMEGIYTQNTAVKVFGRMYGQGVSEPAVAFQGALALAVLDSFKKHIPNTIYMKNKLEGKYDTALGLKVEINNIPVSLLLVINGTDGGIGPDEDYEGNTNFGEKGEIMNKLCLNNVPSVVVESKAYIPAVAKNLDMNKHLIRAEKNVGNTTLALALKESAEKQNIPCMYADNMMPLVEGALEKSTKEFADKVTALGQKLADTDKSSEKVQIVAELAKLISEDAGGVTFMSNSVHNKMRGAGTLPNITCVLSMVCTSEYKEYIKIPMVEENDIENYSAIIVNALDIMEKKL